MDVRDHAAAILKAVEDGEPVAVMALCIAACHAEDAYAAVPVDGDAARHAMAMAFLRSFAVGTPEHSA